VADILTALKTLLKGANPDATDEDINYQLKNYSQDPNLKEAMKDLVPPETQPEAPSSDTSKPSDTSEPSEPISGDSGLLDFKLPSANSTPSSFDMKESSSPVTMNGAMPSMPTGDISKVNPNLPDATPITSVPSGTPAIPATPVSSIAPSEAAKSKTAPLVSKTPVNPMEALLANSTSDDERRKQMLDEEAKKRKLGILPILAGGAGDAISRAGTAFGAQAGTPVTGEIVKGLEKGSEDRKKAFEDKMKNDPQSDISKAYRQMVLQIAPDLAKNANFTQMSAMAIGDKLPLIDTMMKSQAMKDNKAMQMEALKISRQNSADSKALALSEKEDQFNQRRWERFAAAVNPINAGSRKALGVAAVNNMRADRLLATASNKVLTSQDYSSLVSDLQGIYKGGVPDQEMMKHGDYRSIQRAAGQLLGQIMGKPEAINTPEIRDHLVMLTRELKDVDNKAINDNLGFNRVIFDELEKNDPAKFQRAMSALSEMTTAAHDMAPGAKEPLGTPSPTPTTSVSPAGPKQLTSEDQEAIDWANANPSDPRAAKILALHKV